MTKDYGIIFKRFGKILQVIEVKINPPASKCDNYNSVDIRLII